MDKLPRWYGEGRITWEWFLGQLDLLGGVWLETLEGPDEPALHPSPEPVTLPEP